MIEIKEILTLIPHRYPFLLVDRIVEIDPGKRIVGIKNVTYDEPFFPGHFPDRPIMPGVLIVEAMAQTGGVLASQSVPESEKKKAVYFLGMDHVRFRKPVTPGDQLRLELEVTRHRQAIWRFKGKAFVDQTLVAEADLLAMLGGEE